MGKVKNYFWDEIERQGQEEDPDMEDEYLGDGVYASFDGYQIWLKTERETGWHEIALEPPVFERLLEYRQNLARTQDARHG